MYNLHRFSHYIHIILNFFNNFRGNGISVIEIVKEILNDTLYECTTPEGVLNKAIKRAFCF